METLLFSGGLDSACAFFVLRKPVCLFVSGPARNASDGETNALVNMRNLCPEFAEKVRAIFLDLSPFMRQGEWRFPREQLLSVLAWSHGSNKVLLAFTKNDLLDLQAVEAQTRKFEGAVDRPGFRAEMPLWNISKAELVSKALALGAPEEFLQASHSCVVRSDTHCGNCVNCCERSIAFRVAGIKDSEYLTTPQKSRAMKELIARHTDSDWWQRQRKVAYADGV